MCATAATPTSRAESEKAAMPKKGGGFFPKLGKTRKNFRSVGNKALRR